MTHRSWWPAPLVPILCLVALSPRPLRAQTSVGELARQLRTSDDEQVRVQAAVALGASGQEAAAKSLCDALGDARVPVRTAVATALGKLGRPAGIPCLDAAVKKERMAPVRLQIQRSLGSLRKIAAPPRPPLAGPDARFYVAIQVTSRTGRTAADVDAIVRAALQERLLASPGYAVAPRGETAALGGKIVRAGKLKGLYLNAAVERPVYQDGNLSQTVRLSMWTYPGKALKGEFVLMLTQSDTPGRDLQSETMLMKLCAETALESVFQTAATM